MADYELNGEDVDNNNNNDYAFDSSPQPRAIDDYSDSKSQRLHLRIVVGFITTQRLNITLVSCNRAIVDLEIMKENLQEAEKRKEKKVVIRRGTVTGIGIGIVTGTGIRREAKIGTETEIGKRTKKRIVIVTTEIATGTVVENAVKGGGIEMMMMIISEAEIMTGGEIMTEKAGTYAVLDLRVDLSTDQGHVLAHVQRDGVWCSFLFGSLASKRISGFDMAPPASAMVAAGAAVAAAVWKSKMIHVCALIWSLITFSGQIPGTSPAIPGMFPNIFPLATGQQFGALPVMPVQAMTQQATRHARRVYVGGLPPTANEQSVATFFSQVMAAIGGNTAGPGDAVVNVYINHEKKFAFVEMRSVEEASNAMALDGIIFEGAPVKVRRPSDYNPSLAATLGPSQPNPNLNLAAVGLTPGSAGGLEGPDRIFVGGLPYYFTEAQIRELLESFGPLRGFDLVKDRETGNSKGYAFCVYQDLSVTDIACAALNGIKMGDKTLTVRRANQGANQPKPEQESVLLHAQQQIALQRLMLQPGAVPTKVVCLTQVVTADELKDDEEYEDILEDMRTEGGKFGALVNVVIPRPSPNGELLPGVGKVFLEYADVDGASKARTGMNGRKFGGNQVVAVFYPENRFAQGDYDG
ncbi:hypothetical protein Patl1_28897 [Pistacia atlantica]|uniref:Uncharacterized protein n=1 Tax=Pistacia atlantica TaxID=434234 RepID=A0ACC1BCR6_9ROSI|nr:hypothetical protein Patl1_28897 [Pistacia atlantica]